MRMSLLTDREKKVKVEIPKGNYVVLAQNGVADADGVYHYFLEDGELDIKMIAEVLKEIEFDGVLTIESAPGYRFKCKYPESDERILKTYEFWKNYLH